MTRKTIDCPECGEKSVIEVDFGGMFMLACGITVKDRCRKCGKVVVFRMAKEREVA